MKPLLLLFTVVGLGFSLVVGCTAPPAATTAPTTVAAPTAPGSPYFEQAADYSAAHGGVSFLVMADGDIVYETYANGGGVDQAFPIASGTKSFAGLLATAAVADGLLTLDAPVADTITEWQGDPLKAQITARQLLTLTSGLEQRRGRRVGYTEALKTPAVYPPGELFQYGSTPFQVFGELMRRKLAPRQETVLGYLQRRVLGPHWPHRGRLAHGRRR